MTTDKRNITALVKPILNKHGIDNLTVEIDLISAFHRYVTERKAGRDITKVRLDILKDMEIGAARSDVRAAMEAKIKKELGIDAGTTPHLWETVMDFLIKAEIRGEHLSTFANACKADPFNMPKTHQIAQKPSLIQSMWPAVFKGDTQLAQPDKDGGFR